MLVPIAACVVRLGSNAEMISTAGKSNQTHSKANYFHGNKPKRNVSENSLVLEIV